MPMGNKMRANDTRLTDQEMAALMPGLNAEQIEAARRAADNDGLTLEQALEAFYARPVRPWRGRPCRSDICFETL